MSEILLLFPTPVAKISFRSLSSRERDLINNNLNNTIPNVGNKTSANNYFLNLPDLSQLKQDLASTLTTFYNDVYKPANALEIYITQSWLSVYSKNDYHHSHRHFNSILSAVLYINANDQDNITFINDFNPGEWSFTNYNKENNAINSKQFTLDVRDGDLVIFPSWLAHKVDSVVNNDSRVSLALNTFFKGKIGSAIHLNELEL